MAEAVYNVWTGHKMVQGEMKLKQDLYYDVICPVCKLVGRDGYCNVKPHYWCSWKYCPAVNKPRGGNDGTTDAGRKS